MFVLNTINIVKRLHILAQSSGQQSIELNHSNTTHSRCPHEYKASDFKTMLSATEAAPFWGMGGARRAHYILEVFLFVP